MKLHIRKDIYCFMNDILRGILLVFCLVSCSNTEPDQNVMISADKYYKFVELIKANRIAINKEILEDTSTPFHKFGESYWNQYYFTHYILPDIPELKPLATLWEGNLLEPKPRFSVIKLRTNGIIIFTVKSENYYFFGTKYHFLIYNPTKNASTYYPDYTKSKIIRQLEISKDWSYVVENVYFDID